MIYRRARTSAAGAGAQRGTGMADKRGDGVSRAVGTFAALAAAMGTRKLVTVVWKKVTGKEPPSDPQDPQVHFGEALSWAILLGVTMETARLLALRFASRKLRNGKPAS
jgi:hypothetical protein